MSKRPWSRGRSVAKVRQPPRHSHPEWGPVVGARLAALGSEDGWLGYEQMVALGLAERGLHTVLPSLRRLATAETELGRRARACTAGIDALFGKVGEGGIADVVMLWPAFPDFFTQRAGAALSISARLRTEADSLHLDSVRLAVLRERWVRVIENGRISTSEETRRRIVAAMFGDEGFDALANAVRGSAALDSLHRRVDLAEQCLLEWSASGSLLLAALTTDDPSPADGSQPVLENPSASRDVRVNAARASIIESGLDVSSSAGAQQSHLATPSVRELEQSMRETFGSEVRDPLRTWTRLFRSAIR